MDEAKDAEGPASGIQRLDLVFVHLKRGTPILGEMVKRSEGELGLHVIYGPRNKVGQIIRVPINNLQPYKVSGMQLRGAFPQGSMPQELVEKGSAFIVTDKPTMYPDFSGMNAGEPTQGRDPETGQPQPASAPQAAPPTNNPNVGLAQDLLKAQSKLSGGGERPGKDSPLVPLSLGIRRRFGNSGV